MRTGGLGRSTSPGRGHSLGATRSSSPLSRSQDASLGPGDNLPARGTSILELCRSFDANGDNWICVDDLSKALGAAGCEDCAALATSTLAAASSSGTMPIEVFATWLQSVGVAQARVHQYMIQAVFAYGTLRGDFKEDGDNWGVINEFHGRWRPGTARGFKLYQDLGLFYPFAVQTGGDNDVLVGSLLQFPDAEAARGAVVRCNSIEGFDPADPTSGLYSRALVEVAVADPPWLVPALVYHQAMPEEGDHKHFATGDWFQDGKPEGRGGGCAQS